MQSGIFHELDINPDIFSISLSNNDFSIEQVSADVALAASTLGSAGTFGTWGSSTGTTGTFGTAGTFGTS